MKTIVCLLAGSVIATAAVAADEIRPSNAQAAEAHRMADTNHDGLLTRDEYLKHAEKMWSSMPKNSKGQVNLASLDAGMGGSMSDRKGTSGSQDSMGSRGSMGSKDSMGSKGPTGTQGSTSSSSSGGYPPSDPTERPALPTDPVPDSGTSGSMTSTDKSSGKSSDTTRR